MAVSADNRCFYLFGCLFLINILVSGASAEDNPYRHVETLDREGTAHLEWVADWDTKTVTFNVTMKTTGWVGLGLALFRKGNMIASDFIIGGVTSNGKAYFADYHGHTVLHRRPILDKSQDWELISASERNNQTSLQFSRAFDTCDDQDLPFTNDLQNVIWAFGENDDVTRDHFDHRGIFNAYLLDPDLTPRSTEAIKNGTSTTDIKAFTLKKAIVLRKQETQYWCTFHKVPLSGGRRRHIVGFNATFPSDISRQHVHHILLHRCRAPPGRTQAEFIGPATRTGGSECYILDTDNPLPVPYCREVIYIWAVNMRPIFLPEHTGILLDTNLGEDEYLMFQAHYDNPNSENVPVTIDLDVYYTEALRENNVGTLQLGTLQPGSTTIIIPPNDPNHVVTGHCAPGCTRRMFPREGINIFAAMLHTHISGIGVRALHVRNGKELPWIQADDNYNFDFQQFRILRDEVKVMPGDQLINRCSYSSEGRNGTLWGSFSTRNEMCTAFMFYYTHSPGFALCRGEIRTREYNEGLLGIGNYTWNQSIRQMVIREPRELAGTTIGDHLNNNIDWNYAMRKRLQLEQIYQPQISQCPRFHYQDHATQLREQINSGIFERQGRLPGSDGRTYTSVDEDFEHESIYLRDTKPYERPPRCTRSRN